MRLFAAAREAAGTAQVVLPGTTVEDVLEAARIRFGNQFAAVLATSRIWVNGHPAEPATTLLDDEDELAVLPPVSGGFS